MEQIYPPNKFPCTDHIPLKSYFAEFSSICFDKSKVVKKHKNKKKHVDVVLDTMLIFDKREREKLVKSCSIDLLTVKGEVLPHDIPSTSKGAAAPKTKTSFIIPEEARHLETVKVRQEYRNLWKKFSQNKKIFAKSSEQIIIQASTNPKTINIESRNEFAIAIRVYYPFESVIPSETDQNSHRNLKFSHEIVVLGSNTLADLRDKILCVADAGICAESKNPRRGPVAGNVKDTYPSGFIFIDDVFYNDTRHKNHVDYSEVILKWAKKLKIGPLKTATLQTTRMDELSPRFGYPYVYQHQAYCEHILVFSDAWLLSNADSLDAIGYPYVRVVNRQRNKNCTLCYRSKAKWICSESDRLPHNMLLCQKCLMQYNYKGGQKIGTFKIYPYFNYVK